MKQNMELTYQKSHLKQRLCTEGKLFTQTCQLLRKSCTVPASGAIFSTLTLNASAPLFSLLLLVTVTV